MNSDFDLLRKIINDLFSAQNLVKKKPANYVTHRQSHPTNQKSGKE